MAKFFFQLWNFWKWTNWTIKRSKAARIFFIIHILKKKSEKLFRASNASWDYWGVKCHPGVLGRQMPPGGIGASNATPNLLGRQRPGASKGPKASRRQKSGASKDLIWVKAVKATRRQSSGSQNSGVRVHVVKGPGRQRRWIHYNHVANY